MENKNIINEFEYTEDGYIISNGQYIGAFGDDDFEWYGNIDLARANLKPVVNVDMLKSIKEYIKFVQNN